MTVDNYEQELDKLLAEIRELLLKKHHDYGSGNLLKHGLYGILVRLDDKLARLMNFHNSGILEIENESTEDTCKDVAGYGIQGILMLRGVIK